MFLVALIQETKTREVTKTRKINDKYCKGTGEVNKFAEMFK